MVDPVEPWTSLSRGMGTVSILIWLCALVPQVRENYRLKSVEGLSVGFLVAWILGDCANLVGCIMTGQLGVQVILALYYVSMDCIMTTQYWLYRKQSDTTDAVVPVYSSMPSAVTLTRPGDNDNSNRRTSTSDTEDVSKFWKARKRLASMVSLGSIVGSVGRASSMPLPISLPIPEQALAMSSPTATGWTSVELDMGYVVAYFSTIMYIASRLPQIWHNFSRKSTSGVSVIMFLAAFMGNLTYTLSILLAPQAMTGSHRAEFLLREMSYILGAAGTMLLDCIILAQWFIYKPEVVEIVDAQPSRGRDPSFDRLRRQLMRKPNDSTPLLSYQAIYSENALDD